VSTSDGAAIVTDGEPATFSVYVHIPYCRRRCPYCDFNAHAVENIPEEPYTDAVLRELSHAATLDLWRGRTVATVFLGGGTPSLFSPRSIARLLDGIAAAFPLTSDAEITLEANPGTVRRQTLAGFRSAGVTRVSFGVQSFDDRHLQTLGRIHDGQAALGAVEDARAAGFCAVNVDLIFGVPGQRLLDWRADLRQAVSLDPGHISAYGLTYEEGTFFHAWRERGRLVPVTEDDETAMLLMTRDTLHGAGYEHYEISNYARPGRACRHNLAYWERRPYLGLGAGAHTFAPVAPWGRREANVRSPVLYMDLVTRRGTAVASTEDLTRDQAIAETLFLGLRVLAGVSLERIADLSGLAAGATPPAVTSMVEAGMLEIATGRVRLTPAGLLHADSVFATLL
jgi:oxygen-independent coproporphyrinogen-3 oxidase